MKDLMNKQL